MLILKCYFEFSDLIATIALIVSFITLLLQFLPNRKKVKCNNVFFWKSMAYSQEHCYCLTLTLENNSVLPISITNLKLIIDKKVFVPHNERVFLYGGSYPVMDDIEKVRIFSNELPISLNGLSANTFRILFFIKKNVSLNSLSLILETTRGKITIKNVRVSDKQH